MIELNDKTRQDFLDREWVQKLQDAGVDMSNAKYVIAKDKLSKFDDEPDLTDYIWYKDSSAEIYEEVPTYATFEMLSKMPEEFIITINKRKCKALLHISVCKGKYSVDYILRAKDTNVLFNEDVSDYMKELVHSESNSFIEALADAYIKYLKI